MSLENAGCGCFKQHLNYAIGDLAQKVSFHHFPSFFEFAEWSRNWSNDLTQFAWPKNPSPIWSEDGLSSIHPASEHKNGMSSVNVGKGIRQQLSSNALRPFVACRQCERPRWWRWVRMWSQKMYLYMDVSENSGFSPKSSILIGCSIVNQPF